MAEKTIIETIVTVIKVEADGVKQSVDGVRRDAAAAKKSLGGIEDASKKAGGQITGLTGDLKRLSSAFQIAATTMGLFKVMNNNIGIGNLSQRTGQDVKGIQALQRQFEKMGYSAQEANSAVEGFADSIAAAIYKGEGDGLKLPSMFGISAFDANGKMRDSVEVMLEIGDAARKMTGSEKDAILMLKQYGMTAAQAHFSAREASRSEYAAEKERSRLDQPRIEKMREINKLYADQRAAMSDLTTEVLVQLNPAILELGKGLQTTLGLLRDNSEATALGTKAFVAFKAFGINPVLGAIVSLCVALGEAKKLLSGEWLDKSVKKGGSEGTYLQNLTLTDPESGASVADVLPDNPTPAATPAKAKRRESTSWEAPIKTSGVLSDREQALADLVHKGESNIAGSGNGYNAYNMPQKRINGKLVNQSRVGNLEGMTVNDIVAMQKSKQMFAAGRYQFIPTTLQSALKGTGISGDAKFDKETQDALFKWLAHQNKATSAFLSGKNDDYKGAQKYIAQQWRSVVDPDTGKTYADKGAYANHASISSSMYEQAMKGVGRGGGTATNTTTVKVEKVEIKGGGTAEENRNSFENWAVSVGETYQFNSGAAT